MKVKILNVKRTRRKTMKLLPMRRLGLRITTDLRLEVNTAFIH